MNNIIHFTDMEQSWHRYNNRIFIFANTLKKFYNVTFSQKEINMSIFPDNHKENDFWFIRCSPDLNNNFFVDNLNMILNYKGFLVPYSLCDGGQFITGFLPIEVLKRSNAFILGNVSSDILEKEILNNCIRIPRYVIPHRSLNFLDIKKKNKMYFIGSPTVPRRMDMINILKSFSEDEMFLKIVSLKSLEDNFEYLKCPLKPIDEMMRDLMNVSISLCLPGYSVWTFRHLESMSAACAMISIRFNGSYDNDWLYRNKILDLPFYVNDDMSNLVEICKYCLDNYKLCIERGIEGVNIYKKYFELSSDDTYKNNVWQDIKKQFLELGMDI